MLESHNSPQKGYITFLVNIFSAEVLIRILGQIITTLIIVLIGLRWIMRLFMHNYTPTHPTFTTIFAHRYSTDYLPDATHNFNIKFFLFGNKSEIFYTRISNVHYCLEYSKI